MSAAWSLDRHLALAPGPAGGLTAELDEALRGFGGGLHGGYLAAAALQAMRTQVPDESQLPLTLTTSFLRSMQPGQMTIATEILHPGRTMTATRALMSQDGSTKTSATATFGTRSDGLQRRDRVMPEVEPPERCAPLGTEPVPGSGGLEIAHRPALGGLPLSGSDEAHGAVWMRLADDRPVDALTAVVLADGALPALFLALDKFTPMPTVELVVHFVDLAAAEHSPWLLGHIANVQASDGWAIEDGELWTPTGGLVLTARQLRHLTQEMGMFVPTT